jgi:hypothetical protein
VRFCGDCLLTLAGGIVLTASADNRGRATHQSPADYAFALTVPAREVRRAVARLESSVRARYPDADAIFFGARSFSEVSTRPVGGE